MRSQSSSHSLPILGCFVSIDGNNELGIVQDRRIDEQLVKVQWGLKGDVKWHHGSELRNGFQTGHVVQDMPRSIHASGRSESELCEARRTIGTSDQVLVQLHENRREQVVTV